MKDEEGEKRKSKKEGKKQKRRQTPSTDIFHNQAKADETTSSSTKHAT
jgi:hypothetical protein